MVIRQRRKSHGRAYRRGCARLILADWLRHAIVRAAGFDAGLAGDPCPVCCWGGLSGSFDGVDNLVALITGANKGIGKEIARQLADAGFTVYVGSRDAARGERAVKGIGGDTRLLVLDVTDDASIAAAAHQVGTLDILVNNAGISGDGEDPGPGRRRHPPPDLRDERVRGRRGDQCLPARAAAVRAPPHRERLQRHRIPDLGHRPAVPALAWQVRRLPLVQDRAERAHGVLRPHPWPTTTSRSTRWHPACAGPTSTPPPRPAAATRPRPQRPWSGWRCCRTTGLLGSSSPGVGPRSPGDGRLLQPTRRSGHPPSKEQICLLCVAPTMRDAYGDREDGQGVVDSQLNSRKRPQNLLWGGQFCGR